MIKVNFLIKQLLFIAMFVGLLCSSCSKNDDDFIDNTVITEPIKQLPKINVLPENDVYGYVLDEEWEPIEGVVVSDGFNLVTTNAKGEYQFKKSNKARFVYYSTPSDYRVNTSNDRNMALFYQPLNNSTVPQQHNFFLSKLKNKEEQFLVYAIGDPQVANDAEVVRFKEETIEDIKQELAKSKLPVYGISLGDVVADKPNLFNTMKTVLGSTTMPVFTTIGNHDKTGGSPAIPRNSLSFESSFGPLDFSFNRGNVHFVVLDNVVFKNDTDYSLGFSKEQLDWLEKDLSFVSKDKLLIISYHMPIRNSSFATRSRLFDIIKDFKNIHFFAGHTHYNENYIHKVNGIEIYEHVHAATCGAWWKSTINGDGTPNGYGVYEIDGTSVKNWYYKPTKLAKEYQLRLHWGDAKFGGQYGVYTYGKTSKTLIANVWNADPSWKVEVFMNDKKLGDMVLNSSLNTDAWSLGYHLGVLNRNAANYTTTTKHLYTFEVTSPDNTLKVVATDRFGKVYTQNIITANLDDAKSY